jgi:hypothetical protein
MKLLNVIFVLLFATTLAGTAWSQGATQGPGPEVLGYLNPRNNSFRPMYMQSTPIGSPAAISVATGKIVTSFTITVSSAIPLTTPILCYVSASVTDQNTTTFMILNEILDSATVNATRTAGTAKCTVTIPYSWILSDRTTDQVQLGYEISANINTTTPSALINRDSLQTFGIIAIPANGATTTKSVSATI